MSTLERDRFKSQPTLPTSTIQMSPVNHPGTFNQTLLLKWTWNLSLNVIICYPTATSATSSPAMLGVPEHRDTIRDHQRPQSTMQLYNYQGDGSIHRKQYTGTHLKTFDSHSLFAPDWRSSLLVLWADPSLIFQLRPSTPMVPPRQRAPLTQFTSELVFPALVGLL